jgi:hypothetical protein
VSLFSQLLDEVADANNYPLDNCLLRAKLLASRLPGRRFRQWVDAELGGYPDARSVPDYRSIRAPVYGNFDGMFGSAMRNVKLDISGWVDEIRSKVECFCFLENVGGLQAILGEGLPSFHCEMDMNFISLYRIQGNAQLRGMILNDAHLVINMTSVQAVLLSIRNRLPDRPSGPTPGTGAERRGRRQGPRGGRGA